MNTELNVEKIQSVVNTPTAIELSKYQAGRKKIHKEINLNALQIKMLHNGVSNAEEFNAYWKGLEAAGAGSIVNGRGKRPTVFKYNYSMKKIGLAGLRDQSVKTLESFPVVEKRKPGRPVGSKNKKRKLHAAPGVFKRREFKRKPGRPFGSTAKKPVSQYLAKKGVLLMYTTSFGEILPMTLNEAQKLSASLAKISRK